MSSKVIVLAEGYNRPLNQQRTAADGSSTLLISSQSIVLVDTLGPWSSEKLLTLLQGHRIHPDQITHVVGTHGHPDHIGNLNLFTGKSSASTSADDDTLTRTPFHIVGHSVYQRDEYLEHDFSVSPFPIDHRIRVESTTGHTLSCVSVVCENADRLGCVVVAGDLFEREQDLHDERIWLDVGSENPELQRENRIRILQTADYIVPGHGPMFRVVASPVKF